MKWQQKSKYHLTNGTYNICKVLLGGKVIYELWHKGSFVDRGEFEAMKTKHKQEVAK